MPEQTQEQEESTEGQTETPAAPAAAVEDDLDPDRVKAKIAKQNSENRALRQRLKEAEEKATKLDEIEESQKGEAQKLADRLAAAEERAKKLEAHASALEVAASKGIPVDVLIKKEDESLEDYASRLVEWKGERAPKGTVVPGVGNAPGAAPSLDEQIRLAESEGKTALSMQLKTQKLAELRKSQ